MSTYLNDRQLLPWPTVHYFVFPSFNIRPGGGLIPLLTSWASQDDPANHNKRLRGAEPRHLLPPLRWSTWPGCTNRSVIRADGGVVWGEPSGSSGLKSEILQVSVSCSAGLTDHRAAAVLCCVWWHVCKKSRHPLPGGHFQLQSADMNRSLFHYLINLTATFLI